MTDLQEAFREAARREFAMVPDETELEYTFSPGFQRKMQRIIRAQVHGYWNMVNTLGKRIAIAAAIIVMLLTTAMAIKPIRERVIQFFVEVYEEYFEVRFGEEEKGDINPIPTPMIRYTFFELPAGYHEVNCIVSNATIWTDYRNDSECGITLQQELGTHKITLDNDNSTKQDFISHGNLSLIYQQYNGANVIIWEQFGYIFYLTFYDDFTTEQVFAMIDSLNIYK